MASMAMAGRYGAVENNPNMMKQTFESLNVRESAAYMGRFSNNTKSNNDASVRSSLYNPLHGSSTDSIQVRIRGKNNDIARHTGSVTRTMGEISEERKRKQEIAKAANRLKMLEKLEEYRESKMN